MVLFTDSAKRRARSMGVAPDELAADLLNAAVAIDSVMALNPDFFKRQASCCICKPIWRSPQRSAAQRSARARSPAQRSAA